MEWWKGYFWRAIFDRYQYIVSFWPYANIGSERTRPLHHSTQHTIFIDQSVAIIYIMNLRGIRFEKGRTIYKKTDRFIFILLFFSIRSSLSLFCSFFNLHHFLSFFLLISLAFRYFSSRLFSALPFHQRYLIYLFISASFFSPAFVRHPRQLALIFASTKP